LSADDAKLRCGSFARKFSRASLSWGALLEPILEAVQHPAIKAQVHLYWNIVNKIAPPKFMQAMEHRKTLWCASTRIAAGAH
jgi:hypothetical protein